MNKGTYQRAWELAKKAHEGQVDKAGKPYFGHPERMANSFSDETLKIIAILHDVVEDTQITIEQIALEFGDIVATEVNALTRREDESYEEFIERVAARPLARQVKLADLRDNMDLSRLNHVTEKDEARFEKYRKALEFLSSRVAEE